MPNNNYENLHKGFEDERTQVGNDFQNFIINSLEEIGFSAFLSGTENKYPEIHKQILLSSDKGSLFLRFFPDITTLIGNPPHVVFVEAKASQKIEKTAWRQYNSFAKMGLDVIIVTGESKGGVCNMSGWNFVENIRLYPGEYTVQSFSVDKRYPVIDGWVSPRGSARFDDVQSRGNFRTSGAPYREIVPTSLLPWEIFTRIVFARLERKRIQ